MNNGGWIRDKDGRYFRWLGRACKEYATEYTFAHGRRAKETVHPQEGLQRAKRECPFKRGMKYDCMDDCVLFGKTACSLSMQEDVPDKDTRGKECPMSHRKCSQKCALYFNGCGIINIIKGLNAGRDEQ